nr:hypothetical protein [Tanacetum cinerariifolium]
MACNGTGGGRCESCGSVGKMIGALRSPRRELHNELKYVQSEVKMNEISCLKVGYAPTPTCAREGVQKMRFLGQNRITNTPTPPPATTVVNPTSAPVTNTVANHAERPEKFNGQNFKRWQQKIFFYLTTLGLARFLKETIPQVEPHAEGQSSNAQAVQAVEAWKHSDFLCHNYVLNGLIDPLYNVYYKTTTAKELWESLERKYKIEDAGTKKFVNVISQVQDLQVLIHNIHAKGMTLSKTFQVAAIIEKLPPSWVDFKNYLKYKRKEMSVEDLVVHLRIEEDNRLAQKDTHTHDSAKANMIVHALSSLKSNPKGKGKDKRKNDKKSKGKSEYLALKARIVKQKFQGTCYNCDQPGHRSANCKMPKRVNLVCTNHGGWWIDTGTTRHVCADKKFKLTNVLYVPEVRKNLVSGWLLNKFGFRFVFESDKFVLSKNQIYVGKGYAMNDEAIDKFVLYKTEVENQLGKKIKVVRSDRGGEYVSLFVELCAKHGIRHEFTAPYSPQQNGYNWIFKKKMKAAGTIDTYKATLVIKGFRQREGLYYFDTYSPVTR